MTEGPRKASKKFSECSPSALCLPVYLSLCLHLLLYDSAGFLFLFLSVSVSPWGLYFWVPISPSLWPGVFLSLLAGLALRLCASVVSVSPCPAQSLCSCLCPVSGSLISRSRGRPPYTPPLGPVLTGSHIGRYWDRAGVCVCRGMLSHVPTSSDAGTQSNSMKGHTHPLLFSQVSPLLVPANFFFP